MHQHGSGEHRRGADLVGRGPRLRRPPGERCLQSLVPEAAVQYAVSRCEELARELTSEALTWREQGPPRPPIRGDELARGLGIPTGPEIGALIERLREAAFTGEATTREDALALARRLRENSEAS